MFLSSFMCTGVYMAYDSIGAISPYLKDNMQLSDTEYGVLVAVYSLPNVILAFVGGLLTDRFGYNKTSLVFSAFVLLGNVVIASGESYHAMIAGRVLFGIGGESLIVSQTSILTAWFSGHEIGLAFGLSLSFGMLGSLFSSWFLPLVCEDIGYRFAFWFCVGMCVLSYAANGLCVLLDHNAAEHLATQSAGVESPSQGKNLFHPTYWLVVVICECFYGAMTITSYMTSYLNEERGVDPKTAAFYTSMIYLLSVILSPIFGWAVDVFGRRTISMTFGVFLMVPTFFALALTKINVLLAMASLGLSYALVPSVLWTLIPLIVDERHMGKAFGISYSLYDGIIFVCPILYGFLSSKTGSNEIGILVYGGMSAVALICCVILWFLDLRMLNRALQKPSPGSEIPNLKKFFSWKWRSQYARVE